MTITEEIAKGLKTLAQDQQIVEVRMLNTPKRTISGYFSDLRGLAEAVARYDGGVSAIYLKTFKELNAVVPFRIKAMRKKYFPRGKIGQIGKRAKKFK